MADRRDEVRDAYDAIAEEYEALRDDDPPELALLDALLAGLPPDTRVLDDGCGSGTPAAVHVAGWVG
jgi:SAM-dependent methyltransferase